MNHPQILGDNFRYKFGGSKPKIPPLPDPVATPETLSASAQVAGQEEKKRLKGRLGRRGTIFAGRRDLAPARTRQAALGQLFGR